MQTAPAKIALGVCLGIVGAWLAIKAPGWLSESLRQSRNDRAAEVLLKLDPDKLAAACGKPSADDNGQFPVGEGRMIRTDLRIVYYSLNANRYIVLRFEGRDGAWSFDTAEAGTYLPYSNDEVTTPDGYREVVDRLPCLSKAQR